MKKLRLDLDVLAVESFHAGEGTAARGTAHGHAGSTCSLQPTCGAASRGQEGYDLYDRTRYACCV